MKFSFLSFLLFLIPTFAFAGDWSSSGGDLRWVDVTSNPWWLINTKSVNYCIEVDQSDSSIDADQVNEEFKKAISYWWNERANLTPGQSDSASTLGVIGQSFIFNESCYEGIDLEIKLGKGVLNSKEKSYIFPKLQGIASLAILKEYDSVNLKGKGLIFLRGDGNHPLKKKPWSLPRNLEFVLIHELGHIFGIGHVDTTIMDAMAPMQFYLDPSNDGYRDDQLATFFTIPNELATCTPHSITKERCLYFNFNVRGGSPSQISILTNEHYSTPTKTVWGKYSAGGYTSHYDVDVSVYLPKEQKVFDTKFKGVEKWAIDYYFKTLHRHPIVLGKVSEFTNTSSSIEKDGVKTDVYLKISPSAFVMSSPNTKREWDSPSNYGPIRDIRTNMGLWPVEFLVSPP